MPNLWNNLTSVGNSKRLLFILYILAALSCSLVLSTPWPWYISQTATSGDPLSTNWFPNSTDIVDTVVAPNGSVYILDSTQNLYKFDGISNGIQKIILPPPGPINSSWSDANYGQLIRLWIHPQSYDPYLFRCRWSVSNYTEDVKCDSIWYTGVDFSNPVAPSAKNYTFGIQVQTTFGGNSERYLLVGRDSGSAAFLQLSYYQRNIYYLALMDMKIGIQTPIILVDYTSSLPATGTTLSGIVLECGGQTDLACLVSDNLVEAKNFKMIPSGIQPIANVTFNWGMSSYQYIQRYSSLSPNIVGLLVHPRRQILLYNLTTSTVQLEIQYYLPPAPFIPDQFFDYQLTSTGKDALFAQRENVETDPNIKICYYQSPSYVNCDQNFQLQTSKSDSVSRIISHADESFTVVGTTWGNFSAPTSPTGLIDSDGFVYQALFLSRFQRIKIQNQMFDFTDIASNTCQVTLMLVGITKADSSSLIASISQRSGFPDWLNETTVRVNLTNVDFGPQTLTISFPAIPSNPAIVTQVDVPPLITAISPLNGPVGTNLTISVQNMNDFQMPSIFVGGFLCNSGDSLGGGNYQCIIPEGGGSNLPIIVSLGNVNFASSYYFSYDPPVIDSISPATYSTMGPIVFTIYGRNFGYCGTPSTFPCNSPITSTRIKILIGGKDCSTILHFNTSLSCTIPQGVAGIDLNVIVSYYNQSSANSTAARFSSFQPSISQTKKTRFRVNPADPSGPILEIEGQNLGPPNTVASVIFISSNGTNYPACASSPSMNHTWLNCELTRSIPYPQIYNVSVLVGGQYSNADKQIRFGNFPPIANPTNISMDEDNVYPVVLDGSDPDGDAIEVFLTALPKDGILYQFDSRYPNAKGMPADLGGAIQGKVIDPTRQMVFVPNPDFAGSDNFSFLVADRFDIVMANSTTVTVPIIVNAVADPPVVSNLQIQVLEDSSHVIDIAIIDVDTASASLSIIIDTLPSNGNIGFMLDTMSSVDITTVPQTISPGYHSIKYTPNPNYFGTDQFTFRANDGSSNSTNATVSIRVTSVNDKPIAQSDSITTMEDQGCIIRFLIDDVDQPASVKLHVKISSWNDALGNLYQVDANGLKIGSPIGSNTEVSDNSNRLWFEPKPNESGYIRLDYVATDVLNLMSDPAFIAITIQPVNDAPRIPRCAQELVVSSTLNLGPAIININLTAEDPDVTEEFNFQLVDAPRKGRILFEGKNISVGTLYFVNSPERINGEVNVPISYQMLSQGGGNPLANFSYRILDRAMAASDICTVTLTLKCPPPLVNNVFKENDGDVCEKCPTGAMCSEDGRYPPYAAPGYWKKSENQNGTQAMQAAFLPCSPPSACDSNQMGGCAKGYAGVRCGQCAKGYYRLAPNCEKCPDNTMKNVLIFLACIFVGCFLLFVMFKFATRGPSLGFLSIVVGFLQTILILNDLKLKWSPSFQSSINSLSFFTLNIELTSPECMASDYELDFAIKNRIALMVPLFFLLLLAFVPLFAWWRVRALGLFIKGLFSGGCNIKIGDLKQNQKRIWLLCLKVFNIFLNIIFVPAASQALELFDCTMEADGYYYLDAEPSSRCYTPKWEESLPVSVLALVVYVIGIPMYFSLLYYSLYQTTRTAAFWMKRKQNAEAIVDKESNHLKPDTQHFIVVQIIQKLCFITVKLFFTKYIPLQAILINLILMGYLLFVVRHFPYKYKTLNNLEFICTGASIFVLNIGLLFYTQNFTVQSQIDSLTAIALGCVFGSLVVVAIAAFYEFRRSIQDWRESRKSPIPVTQGEKAKSLQLA